EQIIRKYIWEAIGLNINIEFICYIDVSDMSIEEIIKNYWVNIAESIMKKHPVMKELLVSSKKEIEGNILTIVSGNEFLCELGKKRNIDVLLKSNIKTFFGMNITIVFRYDESIETCNYEEYKKVQNEAIVKQVLDNMNLDIINKPKEKADNNKENTVRKQYDIRGKDEPRNENIILGRIIKEEAVDILGIDEGSGIVTVVGDVFKTDIFETKTGRIILTFYLTDYTSSIAVKCFLKPKDTQYVLENIKKGLHCKVKGEAIMDPYAKEVVIMARDVSKMTKIERMDTSEEKRVELHLHTNMSAMDAVTPVGKIIERAAKFGHKAIAITDHGVVQAFPDAQIAGKKNNVKILYGLEGYLVDNGTPIVVNAKNENFKGEFVVFDIETTGFSNKNDKIIEIGAVKVNDGKIVENFSAFVNPEREIPYNITELTGISDEMVREAKTIDQILPKFMEFIGDAIVVAHNANFDVGFIKRNLIGLGKELNNAVMDTVPLVRFLYPDLKRAKLNVVAKYLGISLENHHRAVDDAKAAAEI
ncbi:MAG: exonuclease domain-containing protein, partial [Sarcina sp.]